MKEKNKEKKYTIYYDNKDIEISVTKLGDIFNKVKKLIQSTGISYRTGYILVNQKAFNTLFLPFNVDIVITNKNNIVIDTIINLKPNKITNFYENAMFFYVFPKNTIEIFLIKKDHEFKHIKV